jgi:hypothetical protein
MSCKIIKVGFLDSPLLSSPPYNAGRGGINIDVGFEMVRHKILNQC